MTTTTLRPWTDLVKLHPDVESGALTEAVFAIDLGAIATKDPNVPVVNRDPEAFFRSTYLTADLRKLLDEVLASLAGKSGYNRVLKLRTPFGGGKSHTLAALLHAGGSQSRAVVWAHNSHVGDAAATEHVDKGELNLGHLCKKHYGAKAYSVGFGTDHGTVLAARAWGEEPERMRIKPAQQGSFEALFHSVGTPAFSLPLRNPARLAVREELTARRLERAIGVVYRPAAELMSHYFEASLAQQYDEFVWFEETKALSPLDQQPSINDVQDTWPFGV